MDPGLRRVTTLPLRELWDQSGTREARAVRDDLTENDVRQLLRRGPVQFVEIMMSERPNWIPLDERFEFLEGTFATEADAVGSEERIYTDEFPVYTASEWAIAGETTPIVVATLHD